MSIQKRYIEKLDCALLEKIRKEESGFMDGNLSSPLIIEQSIIDLFDMSTCDFYSEVTIRHCIIKELKMSHARFLNSFFFSNNVIFSDVDYECGGMNKSLFVIEECVFHGFLNISYCNFEDVVYFTDNCLFKGSNVLGNQNKEHGNVFNLGVVAERNVSKMDEFA